MKTEEEKQLLREWIRNSSAKERELIFSQMSSSELDEILYDWDLWARDSQTIPKELLDPDSHIDTWMFCGGRGAGKALKLDTIVPTTNGNKQLKDIKIGDQVFDETGTPCNVTNVFFTQTGKAYKLTFDTGEEVTCCSEHLWTVQVSGGKTSTLNTQEMVDRKEGSLIPCILPLSLSDVQYSIDPKTLGKRIFEFETSREIFESYLGFGELQRLDLLRSIVGSINDDPFEYDIQVENENILKYIHQLACSLGMRSILNLDEKNITGISPRTHFVDPRVIASYEEVEFPKEGMVCLEVDSDSSLFAITESYIMTHNSKTAKETIRKLMCGPTPDAPGYFKEILLIGETSTEIKSAMINGPGGLLNCHPPEFRPYFNEKDSVIKWPNGGICHVRFDRAYDAIVGLNTEAVFFDEFAKYRYMEQTYNQAELTCRVGPKPIKMMTTTPRTKPFLKRLMNDKSTILTRGSMHENRANLSPKIIESFERKFGGTRVGRQELYGEYIDEIDGALWDDELIDNAYIRDFETNERVFYSNRDELEEAVGPCRIVVGVDPTGTRTGDACGIVVVALELTGSKMFYVVDDVTMNGSPIEWATKVSLTSMRWEADCVVVENNFGGEMVEQIIYDVDTNIPLKTRNTQRGKFVRCEPLAMMYEQGRVKHVHPNLGELETEQMEYTGSPGDKSPNRLDALEFAWSELKPRPRSQGFYKKHVGIQVPGFWE